MVTAPDTVIPPPSESAGTVREGSEPVPRYVHPQKFCPEKERAAAAAHLSEHGFVVFSHALTVAECEHALDGLWAWLEGLGTGVERRRPDTWDDERWPRCVEGGILPFHGIGCSEFMWRIRSNANVRAAFAAVWGVTSDDLITSLDGAAAFRPWRRRPERRTRGGWLHVDQNPARPEFECVQGLVHFGPATSHATGGNVLLPGSHRRFGRLSRYAAELQDDDDFFRLPPDDPLLRDGGGDDGGDGGSGGGSGSGGIICLLQRGDLLLWDSRTAHCSAPGEGGAVLAGGEEEEEEEDELLRAVAFVCLVPRSRASEEVIRRRKAAVRARVTTAHRPYVFQPTHEYSVYCDEQMARYSVPRDEPLLTPLAARLVGYSEAEIAAGEHLPAARSGEGV